MYKFIFILSVLFVGFIQTNAINIHFRQESGIYQNEEGCMIQGNTGIKEDKTTEESLQEDKLSHSQGKYEIRASWLTTIGGLDWPRTKATSAASIRRQKEELCRQLDILKEANFNTVIFQTRLRGDVVYPSRYETFAESLAGKAGKDPGYDVLDFAIRECHKRGMELHAWIVTIPIGNRRQVQALGKNSVVRKKPGLCKLFNGNWYLDPGNPETAGYLSDIVMEIVGKYDVDGIHLDYIRYPERGERFPDQSTFRKYGKNKRLEEWRRDNITGIVRRIYNDVKRLKPWVKVSSSPVGKYRDTRRYSSKGWNAYKTVYQDAQAWLEEGIQDVIFPMMYFKGNHFYPFALDWQENKNGRWVVPGLGVYFLNPEEGNWPIDEIMRQIYFSRKNSLDGQAYFRNRFVTDNVKGLLDNIKIGFYNTKAVVPPMTWQDSIAPGSPKSLSVRSINENKSIADDDKGGNNGYYSISNIMDDMNKELIIEWDTSGTYKTGGVYFRIYADNSYPVDIRKPENIVCPRTDGNKWIYTPQLPWEEKLFWSVTTVDRYGNESEPVSASLLDIQE